MPNVLDLRQSGPDPNSVNGCRMLIAEDELSGVTDPAALRGVGGELPVEQPSPDRLGAITHRLAGGRVWPNSNVYGRTQE